MTATPMMNSAYELRYLAHILLTQKDLVSEIPSVPDEYQKILDNVTEANDGDDGNEDVDTYYSDANATSGPAPMHTI